MANQPLENKAVEPPCNAKQPPVGVIVCSIFAGHGPVGLECNQAVKIALNVLSWVWLITGCTGMIHRASCVVNRNPSDIRLRVLSYAIVAAYLAVVCTVITAAILARKDKYLRHLGDLFTLKEKLDDVLKKVSTEMTKDEKDKAAEDELFTSTVSTLKKELRTTTMLGHKEVLIAFVLAALQYLCLALSGWKPEMSAADKIEIDPSELSIQTWFEMTAAMTLLTCGSMALAALTRLQTLYVLDEHLKVGCMPGGVLSSRVILNESFANTLSTYICEGKGDSTWDDMCRGYAELDEKMTITSGQAQWIFTALNGTLLFVNVTVAAYMWIDPKAEEWAAALVSLFFMFAFLVAQANVHTFVGTLQQHVMKSICFSPHPVDSGAHRYLHLLVTYPTGFKVFGIIFNWIYIISLLSAAGTNIALKLFRMVALANAKDMERAKHEANAKTERRLSSYAETKLQYKTDTVVHALTTLPDSSTWVPCIAVCLAFAAAAIILVRMTNFVESEFSLPAKPTKYLLILRTLIAPAAIEEVFWRAFLLPAPEQLSEDIFGHMPTVLFVSALYVWSHIWPMAPILNCLPGKAWRPGAMVVFRDCRFLAIVVLLAGTLALLYYLSGGSLLFCIIVHWLTVSLWLFFMGGDELLASPVEDGAPLVPSWVLRLFCDLSLFDGLLSLIVGYALSWIHDGTRGLPMVSYLMVTPSSAPWMQTCCVVGAILMVFARMGFTQRLQKDYPRWLHLLGGISTVAVTVSVLAPACVEGKGWQRFLMLFRDPGCAVHVGGALIFFSTAVMDMWVLHWYGPAPCAQCVDGFRCVLRVVGSIVVVVQPLLRAAKVPVNPWCGLGEWVLFLVVYLHMWTLRFNAYDEKERGLVCHLWPKASARQPGLDAPEKESDDERSSIRMLCCPEGSDEDSTGSPA